MRSNQSGVVKDEKQHSFHGKRTSSWISSVSGSCTRIETVVERLEETVQVTTTQEGALVFVLLFRSCLAPSEIESRRFRQKEGYVQEKKESHGDVSGLANNQTDVAGLLSEIVNNVFTFWVGS